MERRGAGGLFSEANVLSQEVKFTHNKLSVRDEGSGKKKHAVEGGF